MQRKAEVVICGAGIGGVAAAYFLAVRYGIKEIMLIDERAPLGLTSNASTECYRNWWPGPGDAMVQMMNRSIDLLDELAGQSANRFHLNRRGYLYATSDPSRVADLEGFSAEASALGAGEIRQHSPSFSSTYLPAAPEGYRDMPDGADLITDRALLREQFPYLSQDVRAALHVRRAGWLSAQQYGMLLLEEARAQGVQALTRRVVGIEMTAGKVTGVRLADGNLVHTQALVLAAGPYLAEAGALLGVELPVFNELHLKAAVNDTLGAVGRHAPLLIDIDRQTLEWDAEAFDWLVQDEDTRWLTESLPSGAHVRPEGGSQAASILMLWNVRPRAMEPVFPLPVIAEYAEIALRGLCRLLPGLKIYLKRIPKAEIDGGYYTQTRENRPLACPLPVAGAYVIGAMSGFGIMASAALGELVAAHVAGAELPGYAPAFDLNRYQQPEYQDLLAHWGDGWQL